MHYFLVTILLSTSFVVESTSFVSAQEIVKVGSRTELLAALESADKGQSILLLGGNYGEVAVDGVHGTYDAPVSFSAADPLNPPSFSAFYMRNSSHVSFNHIQFDYVFREGHKADFRPFQFFNVHNLEIKDAVFDGDLAITREGEIPAPTAFGLQLKDATFVRISESEFRYFYRAVEVFYSSNVVFQDNDLHSLRMDGFTFAGSNSVAVLRNHFHNFMRVVGSDDHADMIQSWTKGVPFPSKDITIQGNILNSSDGWFTQSIFMRNEEVDSGLMGKEMFYRNVRIEDNVIINAHLHGITVGETDGLIIRNNSVIRNARSEGPDDNPPLWTPQIRVSPAAKNVSIIGNITSKVEGFSGQPDWTIEDNFFIQDRAPGEPGYYDQVFVAARNGDPNWLENFAPLPGGLLDGTGLGSSILAGIAANLSAPLPAIRVEPDFSSPNRFVFDATLTRFPAQSTPASATYSWDMGDGTSLEGTTVTHDYASAGTYDITLKLALPGGDAVQTTTTVTIPKSEVLAFDPNTNALMALSGEAPFAIAHQSITGGVIRLGQGDNPLTVPSDLIAPLFGARDFTLSFRMRGSGDYRNPGDILHIPKTLVISVTGRGALNVDITGSDGQTRNVKSPGERLYEATWRDVDIIFSEKRKTISILIDGETVAERPFIGLPSTGKWDLTFGHPKQDGDTFIGELSNLRLTVNTEGIGPKE